MPLFETPTEPPVTEPTPTAKPVLRVEAGRHGVIEAHELIHLLDSIEDERSRARFRESLYISFFLCVSLAWFVFYGPRMLWHAPQLKDPIAAMKERELTELSMPSVPHVSPPALKPHAIDNKTMEHLRETAKQPAPAPTPAAPTPAAAAPTPPPPTTPTPQPRTPPPVVADAPSAQPLKPNFGKPQSAGDAIRNALNDSAHSRGGSDIGGPPSRRGSPLNLGGAEILSDTQGVDFSAYMRRMQRDVQRNWDPLIPQETLPPLSKTGKAVIRVTLLPDGTIADMKLEDSTHDEAINRSCWGSITTEGQFPPLPSQFHGPNLVVRIFYTVGGPAEF